MASLPSRLQDENYLNWLRDSMALLFLKEGIEDFTNKRVSDLHADLHSIVSQHLSQQQTSTCSSCTYQNVQKHRDTWTIRCPSNVCSTWFKEIMNRHIDGRNIARTNMKPQLWDTHPWEVAKCFLPLGSENIAVAQDADLAAILKLMNSCVFMYSFFRDLSLVQEVLDARHRLMHSNNMSTSDDKLQQDTNKMIQLLNSLVRLTMEEKDSIQKAIDNISKLRDKTLDVTLNREVIVLTSKMHAVEGDLVSLAVKCTDYEKVRNDLTDTARVLQSLDVEYRQTKAEMDELKKTKDCFKEFLQKNNIVSDVARLSKKIEEYGERFNLQDERIDRQDERLDKLGEWLDKQDNRLDKQVQKVDLQCQRIDNQDQRLGVIEESMKHKDDTAACKSTSSWEDQCKAVQQYLIAVYNTKCSWENPMNTDQQCIPDMYVPPAVKHMREKDKYGGLEEVKIKRWLPSGLSYQDILSSKSGSCTNVYITGDAGAGKTTFCDQLALTWCKAVKNIQDGTVSAEDLPALSAFKFLFYITLRDTEAIYHVEDMIKEQLMQYAPVSIDISDLLKTDNCLIVLDGLDEWSSPDNVKKCPGLNKHIPGRNIMNKNCVFLTTTRNWKYDVSDLKTKDVDKYIELCGIGKKSSEELAQKVVDYLDRKTKRPTKTNIGTFNSEILEKKLSDLITVPVLLIQLVTLWYCGKDFGNSQLQLYCSMLDLLLERSEKRMSEKQSQSICTAANKQEILLPEFFSTKDCCQSHTELLLCLSKLAYTSLFNKQREEVLVFKSSKFDIFGISPSDITLCLQCGILSQNKDFGNYTGKYKKFSFFNKKMQEFLAAVHIVTVQPLENILESLREFCSSIDIMIEMSQIWLFVSGMSPGTMRQLLKHFTNVINADKRIQNYRQSFEYWSGERLIRDIQTCVADCVIEGQHNGHTYENIGLEDLFIDRYTFRHVERLLPSNRMSWLETIYCRTISNEARALPGNVASCIKSMYITISDVMTVDQLRRITGILLHSQAVQKLYLFDPLSRITRETLTTFLRNCRNQLTSLVLVSRVTLTESGVTSICRSISERLMALRLQLVSLTHVDKVKLLNALSQSASIRELYLSLDCTDHVYPQCRPRIDVSTMTQLQTLVLFVMCVDNLLTVTQCMEEVYLWQVTLSMTTLCEFARNISQTKRHVKVELLGVTVREESDDRVDLETVLRGCPGLTVTLYQYYDDDNTCWIKFHTNKQ